MISSGDRRAFQKIIREGLPFMAIANHFKNGTVRENLASHNIGGTYRVDDRSPVNIDEGSAAFELQNLGLILVLNYVNRNPVDLETVTCFDMDDPEKRPYIHQSMTDDSHPAKGRLQITSVGEKLCGEAIDVDSCLSTDGLVTLAFAGQFFPREYALSYHHVLHEDDRCLNQLAQHDHLKFGYSKPTLAHLTIALTESGRELYDRVVQPLADHLELPVVKLGR